MILIRLIEFLRKRLKVVVWMCCAVLAALIVIDALPFIVDKEEAHTKAEHFPGFWSVFGFVGCALIIIVSKWYGHAGIMQREDYYDE
jgi:TRAP-type C4-dicarboxylate transport system permease small subunit